MLEFEIVELLMNEEKVLGAIEELLTEANKEGFDLDFDDPEVKAALFFLAGRRYERKQCGTSLES